MKLTNENYFTLDAEKEYMGSTQFKGFMECEFETLAKVNGVLVEEPTDALLVGSYIDAYFSGELDEFLLEQGARIINSKTGELKAPFKGIGEIINTIENDPLMMEYLNGKKQVVMTGKIANVPFKIKVDALHDDKIVDQKVMKDMEPVWVERNGKNVKTDFIDAYGYDIQGAIYQEIVRQNTGKKLPFILAVATKQESPDKALIQIDQEYLDKALELVKELAPRFDAVKQGLVEPKHCEKCATCRKDKKLTKVVSYKELFRKVDENGEIIE